MLADTDGATAARRMFERGHASRRTRRARKSAKGRASTRTRRWFRELRLPGRCSGPVATVCPSRPRWPASSGGRGTDAIPRRSDRCAAISSRPAHAALNDRDHRGRSGHGRHRDHRHPPATPRSTTRAPSRQNSEAALDSRIVIEQAKGIVAERNQVDVDQAFQQIRSFARDHNRLLSETASVRSSPAS